MLRTASLTNAVDAMPFIDPAYAQTPSDPTGLSEYFFTQGILGVLVVALGIICWRLWLKLETERQAHKADIKAKDDRIDELQEERLKEAREGYTFAKSIQTTLDTFLVTVRQRSRA